MMKKVFLSIFMFFTLINVVNASSSYTNEQGITMSNAEVESIKKIFGDNYLNSITKDEFDTYRNFFQNPSDINQITVLNNNRSLNITKTAQGDKTFISIKVTWNAAPNILSYDVIGFRLENLSLLSNPITSISNDSISLVSSKSQSNGFGAVLKLNRADSNITIMQHFLVEGKGNIFASYQHSVSTISLDKAESFTISSAGIGSVFNFSNNALFDNITNGNISV